MMCLVGETANLRELAEDLGNLQTARPTSYMRLESLYQQKRKEKV